MKKIGPGVETRPLVAWIGWCWQQAAGGSWGAGSGGGGGGRGWGWEEGSGMGFVGVMKPGWSLNWETKIIPCDELGVGATGKRANVAIRTSYVWSCRRGRRIRGRRGLRRRT